VHCSWGSDAMKRNVPNSTVGTTAGATADPPDNPLKDFISGFAAGFSGGGKVKEAWDQVKSDFHTMFTATNSVADFLTTAIDALLDFFKLILEALVGIAVGICEGALKAIADLIGDVYGMMTQEISIPFLSWLYTTLTGEPFTILGAALFVVAIPAMVLFRIATGKNPSQALGSGAPPAGPAALGAAAPVPVQIICGATGAVSGMIGGLIAGGADWKKTPLPAGAAICVACLGIAGAVTSNPWLSNSNPPDSAFGPFIGALLLAGPSIFAAYYASKKASFTVIEQAEMPDSLAAMGCIMSMAGIMMVVITFVESKKTAVKDVAFGLSIAAAIPGIVGFLKIKEVSACIPGDNGKTIAGLVRMICSIAVGVCKVMIIIVTYITGPTLTGELLASPPAGLPGALPA